MRIRRCPISSTEIAGSSAEREHPPVAPGCRSPVAGLLSPVSCSGDVRERLTRAFVMPVMVALAVAACDSDGATQGHRDPCANAAGVFLGCPAERLDTPEEACWRLVECGAIPLERLDPEDTGLLDWAGCVRRVERLPSNQHALVMACLEVSSCDDLRVGGSPTTPRGSPPCLEYADED
jgi:hypothetical protein